MREDKAPTDSSQAAEAKPSSLELEFMKSLARAVCLAVTTAGCASVPMQHAKWPQDCPDAALAAMARRGIVPGRQAYFNLDINRPGFLNQFAAFRAGPIVGIFTEHDSVDVLPEGTKVYGYMWTGGRKVAQAYFTRAELPDGTEIPFCGVLGYDEDGGYPKQLPAEPGTVTISKQAPMTITRRFIKPE